MGFAGKHLWVLLVFCCVQSSAEVPPEDGNEKDDNYSVFIVFLYPFLQWQSKKNKVLKSRLEKGMEIQMSIPNKKGK